MIVINASLAADDKNDEEEDLHRALAASMENHKDIDGGDHKEVDDASVEVIVKKRAFLPLPEEPKGDRNLLCKVGLRLPDGRRIQRNFFRTDPVKVKLLITVIRLSDSVLILVVYGSCVTFLGDFCAVYSDLDTCDISYWNIKVAPL